MAEKAQALASPATWEEPDRAARTAQRLADMGLDVETSAGLMELCEASADPDGALAGAARALAAHRDGVYVVLADAVSAAATRDHDRCERERT